MNLEFYSLHTILETHEWTDANQAVYAMCLMEELSSEDNQ